MRATRQTAGRGRPDSLWFIEPIPGPLRPAAVNLNVAIHLPPAAVKGLIAKEKSGPASRTTHGQVTVNLSDLL